MWRCSSPGCVAARGGGRARIARDHERLTPRAAVHHLHRGSDVTLPCEIMDISRSGASLRTEVQVPPGEKMTIGKRTQAEVIRQTEDGFAVRFRRLLPLEDIR